MTEERSTACGSILVVDDDPDIAALLSKFLARHGFTVTAADNGDALRAALRGSSFDLVLLDLMLPGEDGLSLCRYLRDTTDLPIIMLTAMDTETDRVVGLEMGADDYVAKPFSTRELLARVKAVLRRGPLRGGAGGEQAERPSSSASALEFSGWRLDPRRRQLHSPDGVLVDLTGGEFELLHAFLLNPQQVLSRDQLLDIARGRISGPFDRTIDVQVGRLRRKLESDPKRPELIKTVRGGGYMMTAEVTVRR